MNCFRDKQTPYYLALPVNLQQSLEPFLALPSLLGVPDWLGAYTDVTMYLQLPSCSGLGFSHLAVVHVDACVPSRYQSVSRADPAE